MKVLRVYTTSDIKKTKLYVDDETRVILKTVENNPGDYINASFINVQYLKFYFFYLIDKGNCNVLKVVPD